MISRFVRGAVRAALFCAASALHADEAALREYVRRAAEDPKVFVYDAPAALRTPQNLSPEDLQAKQNAALENGAFLILYSNGLPMRLESHKDFKPHGEFKTWYTDGTLQAEETVVNERLLQGRYFSNDGKLISEVRNGRGKRIEFDLTQDGHTFSPRTETEYVDGLKEGKETSFSPWSNGLVSSETHYRRGVKDGPNKAWARNGQLAVHEIYVDGRKHGEATFWHENGNLLSTAQYDHGEQVGGSGRYAKNGQKLEETIRDGKEVLLEMQWYPEGSMMFCKKYDPSTHRLAEAQSFDRTGEVNGTVQEGRGRLVVCEDLSGRIDGAESFVLEQYGGGNSPNLIELPSLQWNSIQRDKGVLKFRFRTEKIPGFDELSAIIDPPAPGAAPVTVQLKPSEKKKGVPTTVIPIPDGPESWKIYARCTAKGKTGTYSFTQVVYSIEPGR